MPWSAEIGFSVAADSEGDEAPRNCFQSLRISSLPTALKSDRLGEPIRDCAFGARSGEFKISRRDVGDLGLCSRRLGDRKFAPHPFAIPRS